MEQVILLSLTVGRIQMVVAWGIGLLTGLLTLRLIRDLYAAYDDADVGLKETLKKMRKRIFACLIGLTVSSLVAWISKFYGY